MLCNEHGYLYYIDPIVKAWNMGLENLYGTRCGEK